MKRSRSAVARAVVGGLIAAGAQSALAEEIRIIPSAYIGYKNVSHENEYRDPLPDGSVFEWDGDVDASMPTGGVGVAVNYGKFSAALKYEQQLSEGDGDSTVNFTNVSPIDPSVSTDLERSDLTLALSYRVTDAIAIIGGYLDGETVLQPECATAGGFQNLACTQRDNGDPAYEQTYAEDGYFLGASYRFMFSNKGSLTLSAAYAWLDASYEDNFIGNDEVLGFTEEFDFEGDSSGYSLAATWSQFLGGGWGYQVDLRYQQYDAEYDDVTGNPDFADATVDSTEDITSISAGVFYVF